MGQKYKRIHVIVMDSVGIGEAPDAYKFNDIGCDTLGHISEKVGLKIPNLQKMGIGNIANLRTVAPAEKPQATVGKLEEISAGKDTMTGHWELMGVVTEKSFPTYPNGFDEDLIAKIEKYSKRKVICNLPYSGTEVIDDYAPAQLKDGSLIVYTSADPVLQIAAHEDVIPLEELYDICAYVREITKKPPHLLGRIIARPFIGEIGNFKRTPNRHDYALSPPSKTVLDELKENKFSVIAIGKIADIFNGQGVTDAIPTKSNSDGMDKFLDIIEKDFTGLSFLNLVDFDALYGHRRDVKGYAQELESFDERLKDVLKKLKDDDLLIITADHGNDPTFKGSDHTREFVPMIAYNNAKKGQVLADGFFHDVAATICENFGVQKIGSGNSFLDKI